MSSILRLTLHPEDDAKVTPLEVLRDFADATPGWVYLEDDSRHYSKVKNAPGVVLRHRIDPTTFVDLGFAGTKTDKERLDLAVLDRPDGGASLSAADRGALVDSFLDAIRAYLSERPDHVSLHVQRDAANPAA